MLKLEEPSAEAPWTIDSNSCSQGKQARNKRTPGEYEGHCFRPKNAHLVDNLSWLSVVLETFKTAYLMIQKYLKT